MHNLQIIIANQISTSAAISALSIEEAITTMLASGMSREAINAVLIGDLTSSGPLFGAFKNKLKSTVRNAIEFSSNGSSNGKFVAAGVERFQWISVGDGKVCPDCEERHGETGTAEFFDLIGREGSGFSVCGPNCRCKILPDGYKGENLDNPLIKGKN